MEEKQATKTFLRIIIIFVIRKKGFVETKEWRYGQTKYCVSLFTTVFDKNINMLWIDMGLTICIVVHLLQKDIHIPIIIIIILKDNIFS